MSDSRTLEIISAWIVSFGRRSARRANPAAILQELADHMPGPDLTVDELAASAAEAKSIGRELDSLAYRSRQAAAENERRNAPR